MNDFELHKIWADYETHMEEAKILNLQPWVLNVKAFEAIQTHKAKSKLNSLATFKTGMVVLAVPWVLVLSFLIYNSLSWSKILFVFSAAMIALFTILAMIVYIKHIILIRQIDNTESVVEAQQKLAILQTSTLRISRILFLQLPFYATWTFNIDLITGGDTGFWLISLPVTLLFTWISLWLYRNISFENMNKKWFKALFADKEWTSIVKARMFLNEIEEFKKDRAAT